MSCGLILAASLLFSDPAVVAAASAPVVETPLSVAGEPLFVDLVERSGRLKAIVDGWIASGEADGAGFFGGASYGRFKADAVDLAARDMAGHEDLKARGVDGDLKCILRGIAEDMPKRLSAVETAGDAAARKLALEELAYLLNDNVEVIVAPPRPEV
jgi:hypothetical protein